MSSFALDRVDRKILDALQIDRRLSNVDSRENAEALYKALVGMPEVVSCHMVSGIADFLAEIAVPDLESYERLMTDKLLTLPSIQDIRSNFAIRTIKTEGPLPLGHLG